VAEKRAGQCGRAEHLGDERLVEQPLARAAELVGHRDRAQAELDEALPQVGVVALFGVEDRAHAVGRTLVRGELPHGVLE